MIEYFGGGWGGLLFAIGFFVVLYEVLMVMGGTLVESCLKDEKAKRKAFDWVGGRFVCLIPVAAFMMFFALYKMAEAVVK